MSALVLARYLLLDVVGPVLSKKEAATIAARRMGWTFNRCKDILKLEPRIRISGDELLALQQKTKEAKNDADYSARIERLEAYMLATDEEFHSADIDRLRALARRNRDQD